MTTLVGDIGGTHARFGLVDQAAGQPREVRQLKVKDHASLQDAIEVYLQGRAVTRAVLGVAAPMQWSNHPIPMTNSPWLIDRPRLTQQLGLSEGRLQLLNDFEMLALSLPHLTSTQLQAIGGGTLCEHTKAVLGPGTGLGVAACVPGGRGQGWSALASEGGHVTVCAFDDFEAQVLQALRPHHPHLCAERLLCGTGLPTLYQGVCEALGVRHELQSAEAITTAARSPNAQVTHPAAHTTLNTFCAMLGTFAGNVALTFGARGGVYLSGGLATVLADVLPHSAFRTRFEAKGPYQAYMAQIASTLIKTPHAALIGAAWAI